MTDVPPDNGAPGVQPVPPWDPSGIRRSNFTPPPPDADPPTFDDDALADFMAAEVSTYTSEIKLPVFPPPAGAEFGGPPPAPPVPLVEPTRFSASDLAPDTVPVASPATAAADGVAAAASTSSAAPEEEDLRRALGGASTLEAMDRLEDEFRRISNGEPPSIEVPAASAESPDADVFAWLSSATTAAAPLVPAAAPAPVDVPPVDVPPVEVEASEAVPPAYDPSVFDIPGAEAAVVTHAPEAAPAPPRESLPLPGTDALGWNDPRAAALEAKPEPPRAEPDGSVFDIPAPAAPAFDAASGEAPADAAAPPAAADAFAWLFPTAASIPTSIDEPTPPLSEPVPDDASDQPVAFESLAPATAAIPVVVPPAPAVPFLGLPLVEESPIDPEPAAAMSLPSPALLPTPTSVEPWMSADEADDGVWDLGAPDSTQPTAAAPTLAPPVEPLPPVAAPAPTVLSGDLGPQYSIAVPYSTEPPVGPESPDWLDAPPPVYAPPQLVEPPQFLDTVSNPALDPVAPITAGTLALLPIPLPTQLPNIQDRAELPPPPGYEDFATPPNSAMAPPSPEPELVAVPVVASPATGFPEATESRSLDDDEDDVIDESDRVRGGAATPVSAAGTIEPVAIKPVAPVSEPIATVRLADGQPALVDETPTLPSAFDVETAGLEPTALDLRAGRAARLFWLWFAANSSVVSLGLGAVLLGSGMSLRQSIVATLAGVAISFLPLGLGTLAGKWSGQPTMVVSRATFGHAGNILPALLAVITRIFWGAVLLWILATAVAQVLVGAGLDAGLGTMVWQLVGLVVGFVIATVIAVFGYGFVSKLQLVLSVANAVLIIGAAALTFQHLDFTRALTVPDGSWVLAIGGAAIVFSVIGLAWVHSSSDLARYQRPGSSGGASMLWATFGATLPPFLLICWGATLAASDPSLAAALRANPVSAFASLLPLWYPAPLIAAASLGLLSGAVLTIYSGGFALQALGVRMRRSMSALIAALLVLAAGGVLLFLVPDFTAIVRSLIITIAVPVAAWAGIFAAEMMIRTRRFHTPSLLAPGGVYPQVRWLNLIALLVVSGIGYGFVTSNVSGLQWEGFLFRAIGVAGGDPFGASNIGVFVALLLGLLVPLAGGITAIRRQETSIPQAAAPRLAAPIVTAAPATIPVE